MLFDLKVAPELKRLTGGFDAPDIVFFYKADYLKDFLTKSNPEGLNYYILHFFVVDIFFPFAGFMFIGLVLAAIAKRMFKSESLWQYIMFFPAIGMLIDYVESINIVIAIRNLPEISSSAMNFITALSTLKSVFGMMGFGLTVFLLIVFYSGKLIRSKNGVRT